ncbi:MAG: RluA family pseudouridine synthase [Cyclobacteriaceae bacterium]
MSRELEVLYEDNHLIAVNKLSGELVQADQTGDHTLADRVKDYIGKKYQKPGAVFLGVIHRIDRPVSGVVLFARTSKALARMNEQFRMREVTKKYVAAVQNRPSESSATLIHWLKKNNDQNRVTVFRKENEEALRCELSYKTLKTKEGLSIVEVLPVTGRSHQIRAQLSAIGCPIRGDLKYGASEGFNESIALHARELSFAHPVTKISVIIRAQVPQNLIWQPFAADVT